LEQALVLLAPLASMLTRVADSSAPPSASSPSRLPPRLAQIAISIFSTTVTARTTGGASAAMTAIGPPWRVPTNTVELGPPSDSVTSATLRPLTAKIRRARDIRGPAAALHDLAVRHFHAQRRLGPRQGRARVERGREVRGLLNRAVDLLGS